VTPGENRAPKVFGRLPANFETPADLIAQRKPLSQRGLQQAETAAIGPMPYRGQDAVDAWTNMLDTYLLMHQHVDRQIGRVLGALAAQPEVARDTLVVFLADHGEYGGAHGQRGKGGMVYEEAIHVPFTVRDPSGTWTRAIDRPRPQLTSSVDFAPLMMTLASGGDRWREDASWEHLASRLKLEQLLRDPTARGRPYVVHATDERVVEEGPTVLLADGAPTHIVGVRTARGKYASYNYWRAGTVEAQARGAQQEGYDYRTRDGRLELDNQKRLPRARQSPVVKRLEALTFERAIPDELQAPLPPALETVRRQAVADYLAYAAADD
jgi:arylsulfatase A-like enzyme